jgi:FkbM family methyltransferase
MILIKNLAKSLVNLTPYQIRRKRPEATINPVEILLGYLLLCGPITYVQIGACNGSDGDPAYRFTRTGKMRAWLIEPVPTNFAQLTRNYQGVPNITLVQGAIAETDGELVMYRVRPEGRWANDPAAIQWASISKSHITGHGVREEEIEEIRVPAWTLASLVSSQKIGPIDLLQIDVEGFDARVVEMAMALPTPPRSINFEHLHFTRNQTDHVYALLQRHGYHYVLDKWNTLAVHQSLEEELSGKS